MKTIAKKPILAVLLSLFVPGLGHYYIGQPRKGLFIVGICVLLALGVRQCEGVNFLTLLVALGAFWLSAIVDTYQMAQTYGHSLEWYYRPSYVVTMLLLIGPFALPLLWRSPYFSRWVRWGWTTIVAGTVLMFLAIPYMLQWIVRWVPEFADVLQQAGIQ